MAEMVAAMPPAEQPSAEQEEWAAGRAERGLPGGQEFVDGQGRRWRLVRARLDPRSAQRLLRQAGVVLAGHWLGPLEEIPPAARTAFWAGVRRNLYADPPPGYEAHEYVSADGLTLLCLASYC